MKWVSPAFLWLIKPLVKPLNIPLELLILSNWYLTNQIILMSQCYGARARKSVMGTEL
ncbi:hypothetical protein Goarm_000736 [Gossypium armourianum]|uniref:Uncharacterized protein n=1 Tax=Gossypium armourianum TaxID=34283 RepID=A0A7J9KBB2_9ROSI|nr:hypothetical protein [Gossypium armourianum]